MSNRGSNTTSGMYRKIMHTRALNLANRVAADRKREKCPLEEAKRYLRHLGYNVYAEAVHKPKSRLIVCGTQTFTRKQLISYVEEMKERRRQWRMVG